VGSSLAVALKRSHPEWGVTALDNLYRKGSALNLPRLREAGVRFVEGDVRSPDDLASVPAPDGLVECSAEPSVMSGVDGDTGYLVHTNLMGAYNCLELARRSDAALVFLSTSRIYPTGRLAGVSVREAATRFELEPEQAMGGVSEAGISEEFALGGARTLYGTTKLAAELLIEEYRAAFGVRAVVDRCGVIAGPWQMGKAEQGVFTHWVLSHHFGLPLSYIGYGGHGKQVRDLLHVDDLVSLIEMQLLDPEGWDGAVLNVGGGRGCSLSLLEATDLCRQLTGREVPVTPVEATRAWDVPIYLSDCAVLFKRTDWRPSRDAARILADIHEWIAANERQIREGLGIDGVAPR
jgi:CDP-paratose 2-epimerase